MRSASSALRHLAMAGLCWAALGLPVQAQDKPKDIKIGITTFLSGPAAVFGEPSKAAAEMIADSLNKTGGIGGVPVTLSFVDEGAGGEALVSNYRRLGAGRESRRHVRIHLLGLVQPAGAAGRRPEDDELHVGLRRRLDPGSQEVPLQLPHAGQRHARDAGGAGLSPEDQAQLQDHRRRQPGLRLGPRELGDLLHRAEADEARRAGGRRAIPEVRSARLLHRGLAPDGPAA